MSKSKKSVVQVLRDAKQVLIDKGWYQGSFSKEYEEAFILNRDQTLRPSESTCFCAAGAVAYALDLPKFPGVLVSDAVQVLEKMVEKRMEVEGHDWEYDLLVNYNDYDHRTKEEILSLFDDAISFLEC